MIAVDTNVFIRLAVADHPAQSKIAKALVANNQVFLSKGVLMESEWVLRVRYKRARSAITQFFEQAINAANTIAEDYEQMAQALEWYRAGSDFADAIHLASSGTALFHTFDKDFCKPARELGTPEIKVLSA